MDEKYTVEDFKSRETITRFLIILLSRAWIDSIRTEALKQERPISYILENNYMPNFQEILENPSKNL